MLSLSCATIKAVDVHNEQSGLEIAIQDAAVKFRIDVNLIRGIMSVESSGECWKPRFEPQLSDVGLVSPREFAGRLGISVQTESMLQKMSWGPLQVLGKTARWQGFEMDIPMLCIPQLGIFYGVKYLRWLSDKFGEDEERVVAAYNAGPGVSKTVGGLWTNSIYVDRVYLALRKIRQLS